MRRSSNVVFSESRRFCSAALCDVLRRTGDGRDEEVRELEANVFPATPRNDQRSERGSSKAKITGSYRF